jgi:hypothetical protein
MFHRVLRELAGENPKVKKDEREIITTKFHDQLINEYPL